MPPLLGKFTPEQVVWVSEHRDLHGDPMLGEAQLRFLPSRFTVEGNALDALGSMSHNRLSPMPFASPQGPLGV